MSNNVQIFSGLNAEQEAAVRAIDGPVLVFAGAGTGKTRVITHRIAHMIASGVAPENIAGMTFTNKAAQEMRERLFALVSGERAKKVFLGTFHSFCARMLRAEIHLLGWTSDFTIADQSDQLSITKQAIAESGFDKDTLPPSLCLNAISRCKSYYIGPEEFKGKSFLKQDKEIADVFAKYNSILFTQNMLDFDDLLLLAVKILEKHGDVLEKYRTRYTNLLVDEYQDTNNLQFRLIKLLAGKKMNLCAVGDDDQSIYGWRGAEIKNILDFPKIFQGTVELKLEHNYRSTNVILKAANSVISSNPSRSNKKLWSDRGEGEPLLLSHSQDNTAEADFAAAMIENLMMTHKSLSYNDIAVLYRSNYQSKDFEDSLLSYRIPYRIVGGKSFYERREIRDAVAYLKLLVNPKDDQSFTRIIASPPRGFGEKALDTLRSAKIATGKSLCNMMGDAEIHASLSSKASDSAQKLHAVFSKWRQEFSNPCGLASKTEKYLKEVGLLDGLLAMYKDREEALKRQENIFELVNAIALFEKDTEKEHTLGAFLEKYSLNDDSDKAEDKSENKDSVTLMTVHAAKGLEFEYVFIVGMEDGIFPHERALAENGEEEERRLFYVALTRAKQRVFISLTRQRMKHGEMSIQRPSKFLFSIPEELIQRSAFTGRSLFLSRRTNMRRKWDRGNKVYNDM